MSQACENDIKFGKKLYDQIITSKSDKSLSIINSIISGVSKSDFNWSRQKILSLIEDSNKFKVKQAISSIASFNFSNSTSGDFIQKIDKKFTEIINSENSNEILASVLFACSNQRENLPNADNNILALLNVESTEVKIQLLNVLIYNTNIDTEEEFYKKILGSLVSLDLKFELAYSSLAFNLKEKIESHFVIVKGFLNS